MCVVVLDACVEFVANQARNFIAFEFENIICKSPER